MSSRLRDVEVRSIEHAILTVRRSFDLETPFAYDRAFNGVKGEHPNQTLNRLLLSLIEKSPKYPLVDCRHVGSETYLNPTEISNLLNMRIWR